ncbi:heavy metal translocating P-type ATPase [Subtercola sp. PAMC28395]|uniref:heavy metal translocating P-type ATPase n=1 Tax=Subtercola sp. PAMC28395 TaxID=2846775 RepID=UPI001C0D9129|nr:heavy metal translocating P-type ATPase [Subtercola sp. PAMC28395]QWT23216.1 heavy metal translocating P-type ATPase [Subtercola sp. PAMC28395]
MTTTTPHQRTLVLRYPVVSATVLVGLAGVALWMIGFSHAVPWLFSVFAIAVAAVESWAMVNQLRKGIFGIDVLAVIAIVATVAVGEYIASLIIVLMVAGGKALEDFAQGRAQRELSALLSREPQIAHRQTPGSDRIDDIAASAVVIGDLILVRSGEVVPVDGELVSASAAFDESSLTGESLPVTRVTGDPVLSGSVNGNTAATIAATSLAADSQFQSIIALVKEASVNRAPVVRLADRYAIPFTVVSLIIGITAWVVSGDPVRFAEVLVLATPCPLVLAAPVAFMGGMSRAARNGIIVKGGGVLERLARTRTVVFDKTGTLTHGKPAIARIDVIPPFSETQALTLAASAEQFSSHVLASSIVEAAKDRGLTLRDVTSSTESAAQGVSAVVGTNTVDVGTLAFIEAASPQVQQATIVGGELAIYLAIDGSFAGSIIATDPVRESARDTIDRLRQLGVTEVVMLTGDAQATADFVAGEVGITQVQANCLPADKVRAVKALPQRPVLMVGDGVNDSPVLASADIGIAMGARGATAASESADAVILVDDIAVVVRAVQIGRDTVRIALQSIWLGISLSVVLMVIASFGFIPATVGAGIQEVVDLATILNALRAIRPKERAVTLAPSRRPSPAVPAVSK